MICAAWMMELTERTSGMNSKTGQARDWFLNPLPDNAESTGPKLIVPEPSDRSVTVTSGSVLSVRLARDRENSERMSIRWLVTP